MRALQLVSDREVKAVEIDTPLAPAAGEVQLKIRVVALNHLDVWGWRGMAFAKRGVLLIRSFIRNAYTETLNHACHTNTKQYRSARAGELGTCACVNVICPISNS